MYRKGIKILKIFVYKELEILASVDTKSEWVGWNIDSRVTLYYLWLEARPLVERAPGLKSVGGKRTSYI